MGNGSSIVINSERYKNKKSVPNLQVDFILGFGGYSTVYHGIMQNTNDEVAIKEMNIEKLINQCNGNEDHLKKSLNTIFTELQTFKRIQNKKHHRHSFQDFIVTLHSAFYSNSKGCCYFVMGCCKGGDLRRYLRQNGPLPEESVVYVVGCIGSALHFLHCQGVIHRDVKPENIGLDMRGRPSLMDFGISVISTTENPLPICYTSSGTREYLAPEVLAPRNCHSYQSDFWSLGIIAYEMLLGHRPFFHHCSVDAVKFVTNEYGWMWDKLKNIDPIIISPYYDFLSLYLCSDDDEYWVRPFPDVASRLQLDENGDAPASLIVNIPDISQQSMNSSNLTALAQFSTSTNLITSECRQLINGLLDVRIPHRLGSIPNYSNFDDHNCFILHHYHPLSSLGICESPLLPMRIKMSTTSHQSFPSQSDIINITPSLITWHPSIHSLSTEFKNQLMEFSYDSPPPPPDNDNVHNKEHGISHSSTNTIFSKINQDPS